MKYSCRKCLSTFEKKLKKCPSCGGELKIIINKEYEKEKRIDYECPHCRGTFSFNFNICPKCGKRSIRCSNCGYILDINRLVCPGCGKKIKITS